MNAQPATDDSVPDADLAEQSVPADPADELPAGTYNGTLVVGSAEAAEADVLEQSIPVPMDEDYRDDDTYPDGTPDEYETPDAADL
ncbi:hypothetical protein EBN03_19885 [Nocardia stercoris]|uniref:Uncharacterized protein n=1 Tax=Nocardia stercoris TaxID=2483361 RepID=A0A3M2L309_9NOCA|nr:hypothetical protein EBN03_19885 [Nocardia stercoris]